MTRQLTMEEAEIVSGLEGEQDKCKVVGHKFVYREEQGELF